MDDGVPVGEFFHIAELLRQFLPGFLAAPVGLDMVFLMMLDPVSRTMLRIQVLFEGRLDNGTHELLSTGKFVDDLCKTKCRTDLLEERVDIPLHAVLAEMQEFLQLVGVLIVVPVEVPCRIVFWIDECVQRGEAHLTVHHLIHLSGTDTAAFSAADVVDVAPERIVQRLLRGIGGKIAHHAATVPVGDIFEHVVEAVVELDRVIDLRHGGADDTGLPQADPVLEAAFDDIAFRSNFRDRIVVEHRGLDRVTDSAPVDRRHTVTGLSDGTDVDKLVSVRFSQFVNGLNDIPGRTVVDLHGLLRIVVRKRRDKCGDVQTEVGIRDTVFDHGLVEQIAIDDRQTRLVGILIKQSMVLFAVAYQDEQFVVFTKIREHLFEALLTHSAGGAGHKYT